MAPLDQSDSIGAGAGGAGAGVFSGAGGSGGSAGLRGQGQGHQGHQGQGSGGSQAAAASTSTSTSTSRVVLVETEEQLDALKRGPVPCVIDFFADWCGPCKAVAGHYARLSSEFADVVFAKVNIETVPVSDVTALPTFQLWRAGAKVGEVMGADIVKVRTLAAMARSA